MRTHNFLEELEKAFLLHDFSKAFTLLSSWITFSHPGEPDDLLWQMPDAIRPKAAVMVSDILSSYPNTLLGYPILTYAYFSRQAPSVEALRVGLPPPTYQPHEGFVFLGWLAPDAKLPLLNPSSAIKQSVSLPQSKIQSLIAVFQCQPTVETPSNDALSDGWWADLFYRTEATVIVSAGQLLPLPSALEAARLMLAVSVQAPKGGKAIFLTQGQQVRARADSNRFLKDIYRISGGPPVQSAPNAIPPNT